MRTALAIALVMSLLGTALGISVSYYRFDNGAPVYGFDKPYVDGVAGPARPSESARRPRLVMVGEDTFDFGIMSRNERRSHEFVVQNQGDDALVLRFIDKTCQCTDVSISKTEVAPQQTSVITLTWQPSSFNLDFNQTARFQTNDPGRIEFDLTVKGKVQQVVQAAPREINLDRLSLGEGRDAFFNVYSYRDADLEVTDLVWLNEETADRFSADVRPLTAEELEQETGALSGYRVDVTVAPGLALGRFNQTLRVRLNQEDLGPKDVPIRGTVVGNITIGGPGYSDREQLWDLGTLSGTKVHEKKIWLFVKGERASEVEMKIKSLDPDDVLEAELVAPKNASKLARHTLVLRVKPQGQMVNRLGYQQGDLAEIVITTSDPDVPEIRIPLAFAVESNP